MTANVSGKTARKFFKYRFKHLKQNGAVQPPSRDVNITSGGQAFEVSPPKPHFGSSGPMKKVCLNFLSGKPCKQNPCSFIHSYSPKKNVEL